MMGKGDENRKLRIRALEEGLLLCRESTLEEERLTSGVEHVACAGKVRGFSPLGPDGLPLARDWCLVIERLGSVGDL